MELIECGDCGAILAEAELDDPVYNAVWHEVCEVCFALALVRKIQKVVRKIRIEIR